MIILAIDSGLEKTGYSILNKGQRQNFQYFTSGLIKTHKNLEVQKRLFKIFTRLNDVIKRNKPKLIILEQIFFYHNQKTAIIIGQAQGVVMILAAIHNISVRFLTPLQIKSAITGYGKSDKKAIKKMLELTLKVDKVIKEDDEIDAIACGLAYCILK